MPNLKIEFVIGAGIVIFLLVFIISWAFIWIALIHALDTMPSAIELTIHDCDPKIQQLICKVK